MNQPTIRAQPMSDIFTIFHLEGLPVPAKIHKFDAPEPINARPHNHPCKMRIMIVDGGYIERVWQQGFNGLWSYTDILREPEQTHTLEANTVHQIIDLPNGTCFTFVLTGPIVQEWGFWDINEKGEGKFQLPDKHE